MRILDQKKIAAILNEDKDRVFKTLVQLLNCSNPEPFPV